MFYYAFDSPHAKAGASAPTKSDHKLATGLEGVIKEAVDRGSEDYGSQSDRVHILVLGALVTFRHRVWASKFKIIIFDYELGEPNQHNHAEIVASHLIDETAKENYPVDAISPE